MRRIGRAGALSAWVLAACGGSAAPGSTTPREVVVDDALVVTAAPRRDRHGLPPLPQPLASTSDAFRGAHALALPLLEAAGPPPVPAGADQAAYEAWSAGPLRDWLARRAEQVNVAVEALGTVRDGPAREHVVAAALVGMIHARWIAQLWEVPVPAHLSGDPSLLAHYHRGLDEVSEPWRAAAVGSFGHCARFASEQTDAAFGLWLELCHEHLAALQEQLQAATERAARLDAEHQAELLKAAGPPPPGPEVCWKPHVAEPPAADPDATDGAAADASSAGRSCALPALDDAVLARPEAHDARDRLYGVRDPESGVRLSVATEVAPSMDLRPLAATGAQAAVVACFHKHAKADDASTVAVHARLSVSARGRVEDATLVAEPSDEARPPGKPLERCLTRALSALRFDCSPSGQPTQGKALLCMRREP